MGKTETHAVAYAFTYSHGVLTSGAVTCEKINGRWFDVSTGEEYTRRTIKKHTYFLKGDWK